MKTILILLLSFPYILFGYMDLGTHGNTHQIIEESFKTQLKKQYDENFKKEVLEKEIDNAFKDSFIIKGALKKCSKSQQREYVPEIVISEDIIMPYNGEILFKKGQHYNILSENSINFQKYIILIDADDQTQIKLAKTYKNYADILVVNGNIKELLDIGINAMIARDKIEVRMLNVQCIPSVYTQQENKFIVNEYNPNDLLKEK